jgi:integrase
MAHVESRNWQDIGKTSRPVTARGDVRYWQDRVFKARSVRAGGVIESPKYLVRFYRHGLRKTIGLETENRREAAERARERYQYLVTNGWDLFLAKYQAQRPEQPSDSPSAPKVILTVGDYLTAAREQSELGAETLETYAKRFRPVVADIARIRGDKRRFDYQSGGYQKWLDRVHAVPLADITPDKIRAWRKKRLDRAGADKLAPRRALVTANSVLRQARALFSRRNVIAKLHGVELPAILPFDGVEIERTTTKFYGCGVDPRALLRQAIDELSQANLAAFLLLLTLGLRRREADLAEWTSFDFQARTFQIKPTKWYALKTHESAATLPVEPEILALFKGWHAKAEGPFILESERPPKAVAYQYYRFDFDPLLDWLRAKGVQGNKPLHALRKLYGSMLSDVHGIHVASAALRHADIRTTSEFYADRSVRVTPGFGAVISGASVVPFEQASSRMGAKR